MCQNLKRNLLICICIFILLYLCRGYYYDCSITKYEKKPVIIYKPSSNITYSSNKVYQILYWTDSFYNGRRNWFGLGTDPFKLCPYKNCLGMNDRQQYNNSDVILIQMWFIVHHQETAPIYKITNQTWIMQTNEAPTDFEGQFDYSRFNGLFNVIWTYHEKSDIRHQYGLKVIKRKAPDYSLQRNNYANGKNKTVAWFVSSCQMPLGTHSKRLQYVRNLQKHLPVDIYGPCGTLTCPKSKSKQCDQMLKHNYKFYLAFENSICEDYVTEKLWRALSMDIVPIVLGGADYAKLLPPHSYIDIKDFQTPKDLAQYLYVLDKNDTLYKNYFKWKVMYELKNDMPPACKLCEYLNTSSKKVQVYNELGNLWSEKSMCKIPEVFYDKVDKRSWRTDYLELSPYI